MGQYNTARTYQCRAKLTPAGYQAIDDRLAAHCRLYNAALEERRTAWGRNGISLTYASQNRELTGIRADSPEWAGEHRRLAVGTLQRVDRAFQAFFRRKKSGGDKPGYPRFKSWRRYRTLDLYSGADNFLRTEGRQTVVRIKGLPDLPLRLRRPLPEGQPLEIRITRKDRAVIVSLVYGMNDPEPSDAPPVAPVGIDRGVVNLIGLSDGTLIPGRKVDLRKERRLQRKVSRAKKFSGSWRKKKATLRRFRSKQTVAYHGYQHELSARLVRDYDFLAVEDLKIKNMMRSAAGTVDNPGKQVAQKRGLNRSIQQQAWGGLLDKIAYKAASAGKRMVKVNPVNTSRTCSECGVVDAKSRRNQADFVCRHCGYAANADVNAAMNVLRRGLDACELAGTVADARRSTLDKPVTQTSGSPDDAGLRAEIHAPREFLHDEG